MLTLFLSLRIQVSGFGSGSSHRASFLNLSKHSNKPGPGQYGTRSDFDYEPSDSLGSAGAVGFNCSGARSCIPHAPEQVIRTSKSAPGPGDYDLEKVNSLANGYEVSVYSLKETISLFCISIL